MSILRGKRWIYRLNSVFLYSLLGEVLAEIEKQSGFTISIDESLKRILVTVSLSNMDIVKALQSITNAAGLGGYGISYRSTSTPGKIGQWVVDRLVLVDKGNSPEMPDKVGSVLIPKDKNQDGKKPLFVEYPLLHDSSRNKGMKVRVNIEKRTLRMMYQTLRWELGCHGSKQRLADQTLSQSLFHRIPDNLTGEKILVAGKIHPTLVGRDISDIAYPCGLRPGYLKLLIQ